MRDFAVFGSYVSIEGLTFREVVWPLLFDTHIFCTLVCFSLVALPLPTVMAFSRSLCFVVGLCFAWCFFVVVALVCLLPRCRAGLPLPPSLLLVCFCFWSLWLSWFFVLFAGCVFSCGGPPLLPPPPLGDWWC
jgi:hypothetical protein